MTANVKNPWSASVIQGLCLQVAVGILAVLFVRTTNQFAYLIEDVAFLLVVIMFVFAVRAFWHKTRWGQVARTFRLLLTIAALCVGFFIGLVIANVLQLPVSG